MPENNFGQWGDFSSGQGGGQTPPWTDPNQNVNPQQAQWTAPAQNNNAQWAEPAQNVPPQQPQWTVPVQNNNAQWAEPVQNVPPQQPQWTAPVQNNNAQWAEPTQNINLQPTQQWNVPIDNENTWSQQPVKKSKAKRKPKKKGSKAPIIISIVCVLLVAALGAGWYFIFGKGGGDVAETTEEITKATEAESETTEVPVETTAESVVTADPSVEYTYDAKGNVISEARKDENGKIVLRYDYTDGVCTTEKHYDTSGALTAEIIFKDSGTETTLYNRDVDGKLLSGVKRITDTNGQLMEEYQLNEYGNPVSATFYVNGMRDRTRVYHITNGVRDGYTDTFSDGSALRYNNDGTIYVEPTTVATTTAKPAPTPTPAPKPAPKPSGDREETTPWQSDRRTVTTYDGNSDRIKYVVTWGRVNGREVIMSEINYTVSPKTKTDYNRDPKTGDVSRTMYYEFNQNPNNPTLYKVKEVDGSISKYESYVRDNNGKILMTYIHDLQSGKKIKVTKFEKNGKWDYRIEYSDEHPSGKEVYVKGPY